MEGGKRNMPKKIYEDRHWAGTLDSIPSSVLVSELS